jgi:hypothetical protein
MNVFRMISVVAAPLVTLFALALLFATGSPAAAAASGIPPGSFDVGTYRLVAHGTGVAKGTTDHETFRIETFNRRTGAFTGKGTGEFVLSTISYTVTGTVSGTKIHMLAENELGGADHYGGRIRADGTITGSLTANDGTRGTWVMTRGGGGTPWWKSPTKRLIVILSLLLVLLALPLLGGRLFRRTAPRVSTPLRKPAIRRRTGRRRRAGSPAPRCRRPSSCRRRRRAISRPSGRRRRAGQAKNRLRARRSARTRRRSGRRHQAGNREPMFHRSRGGAQAEWSWS